MTVPRRLLLVDDHEDAVALLAELCTLQGHEVATASNGETGVALAMTFRPDVALIDISLPDRDGFSVARELKASLGSSCPRLIALSGWVHARATALEAGFDDFITKPVNLRMLQTVIARS